MEIGVEAIPNLEAADIVTIAAASKQPPSSGLRHQFRAGFFL
jgi:hypothetical protein